MNVFDLQARIGLDSSEYDRKLGSARGSMKSFAGFLGTGLKTAAKVAAGAITVTASAVTALGVASIKGYSEFEQLSGGIAKIFDQMDSSRIYADSKTAWKDLNISANQYLSTIIDVGANFAATMGDEKGYDTARKGMLAISNYASGTGKNMDELFAKFTMITRSAGSYQSIADQFSGILPATSKDFLAQAQAAGVLSKSYKKLTEVPMPEYQEAVSEMLERGVEALGLTGNTAMETEKTISGSLAAVKSTWDNLVTAFANPDADIGQYLDTFVNSVVTAKDNIVPRIKEMLPKIVEGVGVLIDELGPEVEILINELLPSLISGSASLLAGLVVRMPEILSGFATAFKDALVQALEDAGMEDAAATVEAVFDGIRNAIQWCIDNAPAFIGAFQSIADLLSELTTDDNVTKFFEGIQTGLNWITENKDDVIIALQGIGAAIGIAFAVGGIMNFISAISMVFSPLGLLVAVVATVAAAVIENWDRIKWSWDTLMEQFSILGQGFSEICADIQQWFGEVGQSISDEVTSIGESWNQFTQGLTDMKDGANQIWEEIKKTVEDGVNKLKGYLDFDWSLPKLKMPHFTVSGQFSLNPPSAPSFGISWYKNGGILNGATIFGMMGNKFLGGGEAGPEAVAPLSDLLGYIRQAVGEQNIAMMRSLRGEGSKFATKTIAPVFNITVNAAQFDDMDELARNISYVLQSEYERKAMTFG